MARFDCYHQSRLMLASQAASLIPNDSRIVMGLGVSQPPAILQALAERASAGQVSGLSLYYLLSAELAGQSVLRHDLRLAIRPMSLFHGSIERSLDDCRAADQCPPVDFIPSAFSQVPSILRDQIGIDTLITTVSPMDDEGNFSFGTNTDYAHAIAQSAKRVILEVNAQMPQVDGNCKIHVSRVTALVSNDCELINVPRARSRAADDAIGVRVAGLIEDGACLQMGIGAVPDAVCAALHGHRHLGIHTELMTPALAALMRSGVVDNSRKSLHPGKSIFTFAMGDRPFYRFLHRNPGIEAHPVEYVNDPAVISRNGAMVSVNATLQVDLTGACNSEYMGGRQYSGSGGQLDFVRGASASPGGKSIIACHSTAAAGTVSRIVPWLDGPVTTPRNDTQIGSVAKIVKLEHAWRRLDGRNDDGFQVAPFPG